MAALISFASIVLPALLGLAVCYATYFSIHRHQAIPVLASAAATAAALLLARALPDTWLPHLAMWHVFWFGSSFCGMNNNRHVTYRSLCLVWLAYAAIFSSILALQVLPWHGGSLGAMAVAAVCVWIAILKTLLRRRLDDGTHTGG